MAEEVRSERRDGVAVVTIDHPPISSLTSKIRRELSQAVVAADADPKVNAILLVGTAGNFATGTPFASGDDVDQAPDLATLCDELEMAETPVFAAIEGAALGGGLELALAAHVRVALPSARLGFPDIALGLVPGAGGTQRLPKVVGGVAALKMLLGGRAVNAKTAQKLGLVDVVVEGDLVAATIAFAHRLIGEGFKPKRSSQRRDRLGEGTAFLEAVAGHRRAAERSALDAPMRLIECVESALLLPYEIGRGLEAAAHEDLTDSDHSKALRYIIDAERKIQKSTAEDGRVPSRPLKAVGLVGAGRLGSELAVLCLDAGFDVIVAEQSDEALEAGVMRIIEQYDARVASGAMSEEAVETTLERMNAVCGYRMLSDVDVIIDPSPSMTRSRIAELDAAMRAGAVLLTGAERVDVATIAGATGRGGDVIGFRLQPGIRKNRAVEIAADAETGPRAMATARALARKLDLLIIDTGARAFGIGARIAGALHAAADLCLEDGARIGQIDAVLCDWGLPFGSFAWRDALGLDKRPQSGDGQRGGSLDATLAVAGRTGRSAGRGYYHYAQRGKPGVEDPAVSALVAEERAAKGIRARDLNDVEIRKRCVAAMAGAGAHMLADGTAHRPSDIDMVAVHGLGFARRSGGVMYAADLMGLEEVRKTLSDLAQKSTRIPPPSSIFQDLIKAGQGFADLND